MNKSLLVALALLPVVAIGGEQVILEKDFGGNAIRETKYIDGWSLVSYCPGELSREPVVVQYNSASNKEPLFYNYASRMSNVVSG